MTTLQTKNTAIQNARIAGVLYLVIIATGLLSEMFIRSGIIVSGNAAATAKNIIENQSLYRMSIASDLIMVLSDVALALLFYILLKPVNEGLALMAAFFRLVQDAIIGLNLLNSFKPLLIFGKANIMQGFTTDQLDSMVYLSLHAHSTGYLLSGVFFGASCVILGYLVYTSMYFPKWLGIIAVATGIGYLIDGFTNILAPEYASLTEILLITVAITSELSFSLYLLIKGVKTQA